MSAEIRDVVEADLDALAAFTAALQQLPGDHVAYLSDTPEAIASELAESTWADAGVVAVDDGLVVGWLIGDVDEEMGRVWWLGPFVRVGDDWASVADDLLAAARARLPERVGEEEMAVDEHHHRVLGWAPRHGFVAGTGSVVATLRCGCGAPSRVVRPIADGDRGRVAALHDALFPGTHTRGDALVEQVDDRHARLVVEVDGAVAGYVAVERQSDGSGYVDYLGVDPTLRRQGLGADLVRAGVEAVRAMGAAEVSLTVRDDADGARELYASLGFEIGRRVIPLRRGFDLG